MPLHRLLRLLRPEPLKNSGSLARDLLASERTFLAWTRTGLGFIALGVALEKTDALALIAPPPPLLHLEHSRTRLSAALLVASGTACVAHGTRRYFASMRLLQQGLFRPNVPGITLVAATSIGLALAGTLMVMEDERGGSKVEEASPNGG